MTFLGWMIGQKWSIVQHYNKSIDDIIKINKELDKIHYSNLSDIASIDGSELIAEIEVLLRREEHVKEELMEIYRKYIGG